MLLLDPDSYFDPNCVNTIIMAFVFRANIKKDIIVMPEWDVCETHVVQARCSRVPECHRSQVGGARVICVDPVGQL